MTEPCRLCGELIKQPDDAKFVISVCRKCLDKQNKMAHAGLSQQLNPGMKVVSCCNCGSNHDCVPYKTDEHWVWEARCKCGYNSSRTLGLWKRSKRFTPKNDDEGRRGYYE